MKLVIGGAGGFGREVAQWYTDVLIAQGFGLPYAKKAIVFFDEFTKDTFVNGFKVIKSPQELNVNYKGAYCISAIGDNEKRLQLLKKMEEAGLRRCPPIIHPSSVVSDYVEIGPGSIICPRSIISVNTSIGSNCIVNLNSTIGHDTKIGSDCNLAPGVNVSGSVKIGHSVNVGTNSAIREKLNIGNFVTIGMGSVVVKDIDSNVLVLGNPAKARE